MQKQNLQKPKEESGEKCNENCYENQNMILRELYEARLQRKKQNDTIIQENSFVKKTQIKTEQIKNQISQNTNNILFNQLIYDKRANKPTNLISISSLFQENIKTFSMKISTNIETIFMTTYGFQTQILLPIFQSGKKIIIVSQVSKGKQQIYKEYAGYKNVTVVMKQKGEYFYGIFHPKLWLIKFKTFLRIVVSTGNLHVGDWAYWQNAYWYQDFPLKSNKQKQILPKQVKENNQFNYDLDFVKSLQKILLHTGLSSYKVELDIKIEDYKFENINVILIPSIPGKYKRQEEIKEQGLGKIKYIVEKLGKKMNQPTFTYNSTSLGTIDFEFCESLYSSFVPNFPKLEVNKFKLIYPTEKYVKEQSFMDDPATLFLLQKNFRNSNLGNQVFYKFTSNPSNCVNGCIPHLKTIIVDDENDHNCLFYIGSHNMTKAAWGSLNKKTTSLEINNCQLGVLFLNCNRDQIKSIIPFQYPPMKYSSNDIPYIKDKSF